MQIAADVARRQAGAAQAGDHQVRIVLADAAAFVKHLQQRRRDLGLAGRIGEFGVHLGHQRLGDLRARWLRLAGSRARNR